MPANLAALLGAARAIAWSRWGAIVRLSTLDGCHWQLVAVDADDATHVAEAPTGCDVTPEGAVQVWLDGVHALDADADVDDAPELTAPRTLADLYPELPGVIVVPAPAAAGREVA